MVVLFRSLSRAGARLPGRATVDSSKIHPAFCATRGINCDQTKRDRWRFIRHIRPPCKSDVIKENPWEWGKRRPRRGIIENSCSVLTPLPLRAGENNWRFIGHLNWSRWEKKRKTKKGRYRDSDSWEEGGEILKDRHRGSIGSMYSSSGIREDWINDSIGHYHELELEGAKVERGYRRQAIRRSGISLISRETDNLAETDETVELRKRAGNLGGCEKLYAARFRIDSARQVEDGVVCEDFSGKKRKSGQKEKARKVRQFRRLSNNSEFRGRLLPPHRNRSSRGRIKILHPRFVLRGKYRESLSANKTTHLRSKKRLGGRLSERGRCAKSFSKTDLRGNLRPGNVQYPRPVSIASLLRPAFPTRRQTIAEDREKLCAKNFAVLATRGGNVIVLLGSRRKVSRHLVCPFSRVTPRWNGKFVKGREAWEERWEEGCNFRPAT